MTTAENIAVEVHNFLVEEKHRREAEARRLRELGVYLHCRECGESELLDEGMLARMAANYWPVHCGVTMEIRR